MGSLKKLLIRQRVSNLIYYMGAELPGSYFFLLNYSCSHLHKALVFNCQMRKSVIFLCYTDGKMNIWFCFGLQLFVCFLSLYMM